MEPDRNGRKKVNKGGDICMHQEKSELVKTKR